MRKKEIKRVEEMIRNDRYNTRDDFSKLLYSDLNKVLSEYFEYKNMPEPIITKNGEEITFNLTFNAMGIKTFTSLPK